MADAVFEVGVMRIRRELEMDKTTGLGRYAGCEDLRIERLLKGDSDGSSEKIRPGGPGVCECS